MTKAVLRGTVYSQFPLQQSMMFSIGNVLVEINRLNKLANWIHQYKFNFNCHPGFGTRREQQQREIITCSDCHRL